MKTISKGLILALVIQFALILPFQSIWLQQNTEKAKAEGPVGPTDPSLGFSTSSSTQQVVEMEINGADPPGPWTFTAQRGSINVDSFYNGAQVPRYTRNATNSDTFMKYTLTSPNIACQGSFLAGGDLGGARQVNYRSPIYLITTRYSGETNLFLQSGLYRESHANHKLVKLIDRDMGDASNFCQDLTDDQIQIINIARTSALNQAVVPIVVDLDLRCTQMQTNWNNIVSNMRALMIPAPSATPGVGRTGNAYWVNRDSVGVRWPQFGAWVFSAFGRASYGSVFDDTYVYTLDLGLTNDGQEIYDEIATLAGEIKDDIDRLKEVYPGDSWPPGCAEVEKFLWVERDPPEYYTSLDEFSTDFDKIYQFFEDAIASRDEPISTGTEDVCGNGVGGLMSGKIFQWLFCELANIIHGIAASIMTRATEYLTDSIGVDIENVEFKGPKKHSYPTESTGTETTTPRTAAPMDISGTLKFTTEDEYDRAKGDSGAIAVKVKNADATSAIIDVTSTEIAWGTWESTRGEIDCRFRTTENIPAEWTAVKIYSEDSSGELRFRFSISYPPAGNRFIATSSIQ